MGNETEINIILDESDPPNPIFVEIENKHGISIRIGERTIRANGYYCDGYYKPQSDITTPISCASAASVRLI